MPSGPSFSIPASGRLAFPHSLLSLWEVGILGLEEGLTSDQVCRGGPNKPRSWANNPLARRSQALQKELCRLSKGCPSLPWGGQ